jgi:membrane peptidoglycan carboxypeptidase
VRRALPLHPSKKSGSFLPVLVSVILGLSFLVHVFLERVQQEFPPVEVIAEQYPVLRQQGPDEPPEVVLRRNRPTGWVPLSAISRVASGAVIVSEDWAFYSHPGYDLGQIREAIEHDLEKGEFARGASTITQQVVRNVFLDKEKTLWRKAKELVLAVRLDRKVSKNRILEIYLNIAEWGPGFHGIGAASRYYFDKHPSELTAREGAFLAMLLPSALRGQKRCIGSAHGGNYRTKAAGQFLPS